MYQFSAGRNTGEVGTEADSTLAVFTVAFGYSSLPKRHYAVAVLLLCCRCAVAVPLRELVLCGR
jgi:hypothetical protein